MSIGRKNEKDGDTGRTPVIKTRRKKKKGKFTVLTESNIICASRKDLLSDRAGWTAVNVFRRELYLGVE